MERLGSTPRSGPVFKTKFVALLTGMPMGVFKRPHRESQALWCEEEEKKLWREGLTTLARRSSRGPIPLSAWALLPASGMRPAATRSRG